MNFVTIIITVTNTVCWLPSFSSTRGCVLFVFCFLFEDVVGLPHGTFISDAPDAIASSHHVIEGGIRLVALLARLASLAGVVGFESKTMGPAVEHGCGTLVTRLAWVAVVLIKFDFVCRVLARGEVAKSLCVGFIEVKL